MDPHMSTLHLPFFVCLPTVRQPVCLCLVCLLATFPSLTFGFIFPFRLPTCAHSIHNHHCPPIRAPLLFIVSSLPFLYSCAFASNYPPQPGWSAHCGGDNYVVYFTACVTEARLEGRTLGKARLVVGAHSQGNGVTKTKFLNLSTLADLLHICVASIRYKRSPTFTSFLFLFYFFIYLFVVFITIHLSFHYLLEPTHLHLFSHSLWPCVCLFSKHAQHNGLPVPPPPFFY